MANQLRLVFGRCDLKLLDGLLADEVRWRDEGRPGKIRTRADVLVLFARLFAEGMNADVVELGVGVHGVLLGIRVKWPKGGDRLPDRLIYHVYIVEHDRVIEIRQHKDRQWAAASAGI